MDMFTHADQLISMIPLVSSMMVAILIAGLFWSKATGNLTGWGVAQGIAVIGLMQAFILTEVWFYQHPNNWVAHMIGQHSTGAMILGGLVALVVMEMLLASVLSGVGAATSSRSGGSMDGFVMGVIVGKMLH